MTLTSNNSYPNNSITNFSTLLDDALQLSTPYTVAIVEYSYYVAIKQNFGYITFESGESIQIDGNERMNMVDLCTILTNKFANYKFAADYNEKSNILTVECIKKFHFDINLCKIFNIKYNSEIFVDKFRSRMPKRIEIVKQFHVYCDIISDQYYNNKKVKLLKILKIDGNLYDFISKQYDNPHYVSVDKTFINKIGISIKNEKDEDLAFFTGPITIKLHFKEQ